MRCRPYAASGHSSDRPELPGLDRAAIREWYNGYHWLGAEKVYNPFGLLKLFRSRRFRAHWFETATPTFLVDTLLQRGVEVPALDGLRCDEELLSSFDVDAMTIEALLFQTGYLTIVEAEDVDEDPSYRLGYPNREVRQSLNRSLLTALAPDWRRGPGNGAGLRRRLAAGDLDGVEALFRALFAGIPHQWRTRNEIARYEGYWASVFYAFVAASGLDVAVEDSGSRGRLDMVVRHGGAVYLFEFKVVEQAPRGAALAQLRARDYAGKHRAAGRPVRLIGVEFSSAERNVVAFDVEDA